MHAGSLYQELLLDAPSYIMVDGGVLSDSGRERWVKHRHEVARDLARAHKFAISERSFYQDEEMHRTAASFFDADALRLPFPSCYFEFSQNQDLKCLGIVAASKNGFIKITPFSRRHAGSIDSDIWVDEGCFMEMEPGGQWRVLMCTRKNDTAANRDDLIKLGTMVGQATLDTILFMSTKHASLRKVDGPRESVRLRRAREGKPPLYEYHVVTIDPIDRVRADLGGTHASPRLHWRRGHLRHLDATRVVPVKPALVGIAERGIVDKSYVVPPASKAL